MKRLRIALAAFAALVLGGCGGDSIQSPDFTQVLLGLTVTAAPGQPTGSVPVGRTRAFEARATFSLPPGSDPETDVRPDPVVGAVWSSSNPSVATVDAMTGVATAVSVGTTMIRATLDGADGEATMVVVAPVVESITITLNGPPTISVGSMRTATANGVFSNGTTQPIVVNWASTDTARVTVRPDSATTSPVNALMTGSATITATSVANPALPPGSLGITVQQRVVSLVVTPNPGITPLGRPIQFTATGTGLNSVGGAPVPLVPGDFSVRWSVANAPPGGSQVANIDAVSGVANGLRVGTAAVTATAVDEAVTANAQLQITPPIIDRIVISPQDATIPLGGGRTYSATAIFTNNTSTPQRVTWAFENPSPANVAITFSPNPSVSTTATAPASSALGTGTIRASAVSANGTAVLDENGAQFTTTTGVTVGPAICDAGTLVVTPASATVTEGRTRQFIAGASCTDGTVSVVPVTWMSSDMAIATINSMGVATGVMQSPTPVTIRATEVGGARTATAQLTVTDDVCTTPLTAANGVVPRQNVTPACVGCFILNPLNFLDTLPNNFSTIFAGLALTGGNATLGAQTPITGTPTFAAGNNAGFVVARPIGTLVLAELFSQLQVSTVRQGVTQETSGGPMPPPGGLIPLPLRVDLLGQDINGEYDLALVSIRTSIGYDAIDLTFNSGVATALSEVLVFQACGTAEIPTAGVDLVNVERIEPVSSILRVGATRDYALLGRYSDGSVRPIPDADIDWDSSNDSVATVATNGLVAGVAVGGATITATLKTGVAATGTGRTATATVTVIANVCTAALSSSAVPPATVFGATSGICLFCSTSDLQNVIDAAITNFGTLSAPVSLLGGSVSVTARANQTLTPGGSNRAGFLVSRPTGTVVEALLLSQLRVEALNNGAVVATSSPLVPLQIDLLGLDLTGGGDQAVVSVATPGPFDALRLTFDGGLLSADLDQLGAVNVFQACSTVADLTP